MRNLVNEIVRYSKINKSLLGPGLREGLDFIKKLNTKLKIYYVKSGTKFYDWKVPYEWEINDGYIYHINSKKKFAEYKKNPLSVLGFSTPIDESLSYKKIVANIYFDKFNKNFIPFRTSYYKNNWGFCMSYNEFKKLPKKGKYKVLVDSKLKKGHLNYGEIVIKGKSQKEIIFSCNICHLHMINNESVAPVLLAFISKNMSKNNFYTYRFLFIPETIGSIVYIKKNFKRLKKNLIAGFHVTCFGDKGNFSFIKSRYNDSYPDKIFNHFIKSRNFRSYKWYEGGSDERQFASPNINLPFITITRTKFFEYKTYHTSGDKFNKFVTNKSISDSYNFILELINILENNLKFKSMFNCDPFLSKRNLYPSISTPHKNKDVRNLANFISYCDGKSDLIDISNFMDIDIIDTIKISKIALGNHLIKLA